jgi:methyltransferase-like protein
VDLTDCAPTTKQLRESYDEIPYPNYAKPFTHISRLAALGRLRGLTPASPDACRVLELGCSDGGNLLPMAMQFPQSRFVGIDLSPVQISSGCDMVSDLSLTNLELRARDILELGERDLGSYDYIIVHGVYSWVPPEVQEKILSICRDHLSVNGLAYVSYNVYPGWHGKQALQQMLRYHTRGIDEPREKARAALDLLAAFPGLEDFPDDPGAIQVQRLLQDLESVGDPETYLIHEFLIDANQPLYFHEFLDRAATAGLRYVDDAFPAGTALDRLPPASRQWICESFPDYVGQQQYVDFMFNISFRRSLLCHRGLSLDHDVTFERLQSLYATATCRREDNEDSQGEVARFRNDPGQVFSVKHPGLVNMLELLVDARPAPVSVAELRDCLGDDVSDLNAGVVFDNLHRNAAIEFTSHPFNCTPEIGQRPCTSRLARYQSASGTVTSGTHQPIGIKDALQRHLISLLDGTQTVPQLISSLQQRVKPDRPLSDTEWQALVRAHLSMLAGAGLLQQPQLEG